MRTSVLRFWVTPRIAWIMPIRRCVYEQQLSKVYPGVQGRGRAAYDIKVMITVPYESIQKGA